MTQLINALIVVFIAVNCFALMWVPLTRDGRSWGSYVVDTLRALLVWWFIIVGAGFGIYWLNVDANLHAGLLVFCLLIVGLWAVTRFTPKWLSTALAGLGLAGMVTYLGLLLSDPDTLAALQRQNDNECTAQLVHHELPTRLCIPYRAGGD